MLMNFCKNILFSVTKQSRLMPLIAILFVACTDYEAMIDEDYEEWEYAQQLSSSSAMLRSVSSSSIKTVIESSSSKENISSSSEKQVVSSSSEGAVSSSSKKGENSSCSQNAKSSSSVLLSSSSITPISSSSRKNEISSSSILSSSSGKASWAYLNPAISYGEITDDRDGQVYKTVVIGEQTWMAENLNLEMDNSYCYNDSVQYCAKYGRLYTWTAAMDSIGKWSDNGKGCGYYKICEPTYPVQGICPTNWHLPTKDEFKTLFSTIGGEYIIGAQWSAGEKLKSTTGWSDGSNGSNFYGFSAIPAGLGTINKNFNYEKDEVYFHTSTEAQGNGTYSYYMRLNGNAVLGSNGKNLMYSIRCIKDSPNNLPRSSSSTNESSSSTTVVPPCKTSAEDNCEYGELKDNRDGKKYKAVKIGNQWWMTENLNYRVADSYCYGGSDQKCDKYGRLYTWKAVMDSVGLWTPNGKGCGFEKECSPTYPVRGVCPEYWHVPTKSEFELLISAVGGQSSAGKLFKYTSDWNNGGNGIDAYSLSILPAGFRGDDEGYAYEGDYANFWSSTEYSVDAAYYMDLWYKEDSAKMDFFDKRMGRSIRCVKD